MTIFDVLHPTSDTVTAVTAGSAGARDVLRRYRNYRKAISWAAITCSAEDLRQAGVAAKLRNGGHSVDVRSCEELISVMSVGVAPARIIMHDNGVTAAPIRCAVNAGVGRLVLGCRDGIAALAGRADRSQRVLVDVTTDCTGDTIAAVLGHPRLDLIGLHARLTPEAPLTGYADAVARMIAQMADIRRQQNVILTRVSLAGGDVLSDRTAATSTLCRLAAELEDAFDDACARYRFPRPALILAPS